MFTNKPVALHPKLIAYWKFRVLTGDWQEQHHGSESNSNYLQDLEIKWIWFCSLGWSFITFNSDCLVLVSLFKHNVITTFVMIKPTISQHCVMRNVWGRICASFIRWRNFEGGFAHPSSGEGILKEELNVVITCTLQEMFP